MPTKVVFLSSPGALRSHYGSTFLRGQQLSQLLSERLSEHYSVSFTTSAEHADSIVVLTKACLVDASPDQLATLRADRNILLADPVDLGMSIADLTALAAGVDGFVASSKRQMAELMQRFPDKPCHLVTHNVDQRLPAFVPPDDRLRLAYVGLAKNCRHRSELSRVAEILETPTGRSGDGWISRLPEFNCHYALRRDESLGFKPYLAGLFGRTRDPVVFRPSGNGLFGRPDDFLEFKPFTKGFTAAHCFSPILTDRSEGDAEFYLPGDYPFFLPAGSWRGVNDAIERVRDAFGGKSWQYAVEVMREIRDKSSPDHIAREFEMMLAHYR